VLVFSMEMGGSQLAMRMLGSVGRLDQNRLRTGRLNDDDWPRLTHAIQKLNSSEINSSGTGTADQNARLTGSIAVTVVEVLANGNLMVRGEKQLALTEGAEVIQVSGIVRPEDISPNNTLQSRRLANAQIAYRGTGDMASATRPGWGTNLLMKIWPF